MPTTHLTLDANEAVAKIAYQCSEVIAIYPITPSSPMGEWADQWASEGKPNLWGMPPHVSELQSEAGVAGSIHGALQAGAMATTFTASQGLLLMIPNMYKIAGELTPFVMHVAARSLAAQGLSIFGDHQDVMAARATGFAQLCSGSVQEAADLALVAHATTLEARIPFIHFFDGFRTSHEVGKIAAVPNEAIRAMINDDLVQAHRARAMTPDHPVIRGTAQNPDVYFQARESVNSYYNACPLIVQNAMDQFAELTGRAYKLFDYHGHPDAERVIVMMGSGAEATMETVDALLEAGEKVGVVKVRLYRPFSTEHLMQALPATVKKVAVLDRTKEPGCLGEPLYLDVLASIHEGMAAGVAPFATAPVIVGGRYGLSSKEFTPAMIKGIYDELAKDAPKNHFTVGIRDDITHTSIAYDPSYSTESPEVVRAVFFGLGADGTVGANKNSIKIIGEGTDNYAQGYFVFDSKKSGSLTTSHLRFGPKPIRSTYLITRANFIACHQFSFLERTEMLHMAEPGATFLLNSPFGPDEVWEHLPITVQAAIMEKHLKFFVIDAESVAEAAGMGRRINTVMQACFFAISGILPRDEAIAAIKKAIEKTYGKRGGTIVEKNWAAVDAALSNMHAVTVPSSTAGTIEMRPPMPPEAPEFLRNVTAKIIAGKGDELPVSALPVDGTWPVGTTKWEKRNIANEIPVWETDICIQCGKCTMVCPHGVIRGKLLTPEQAAAAPPSFKTADYRSAPFKEHKFALQVAPEDCTGCALCVEVCPVKDKSEAKRKAINMTPQPPLREQEVANWAYFESIDSPDRDLLKHTQPKDAQFLEPLFEFSGACAGCGETPYVKMLTQMFGDRLYMANATGCSSIYGGNLPTTPYTTNRDGRGPVWANSLFEDNAEFGLGFRMCLDKQTEYAQHLVQQLAGALGDDLVAAILEADQSNEAGINRQRTRVQELREKLARDTSPAARDLLSLADHLVKKSVWIMGGDGWAYDIGFGGVDQVIASGRDVNILVLDTEVYSNTGGQMSKSTPRAAVAKFAAAGKPLPKKDLAMIAMTYGNAYVARVAMGANDTQAMRVFAEAESYDGPSLILAYSHCIAHGYDLRYGMEQQKKAVLSGHWPLVRFDPRRVQAGLPPMQLDSKAPKIAFKEYAYNETRYTMLAHADPERAKILLGLAEDDVRQRWALYENMAHLGETATDSTHDAEET